MYEDLFIQFDPSGRGLVLTSKHDPALSHIGDHTRPLHAHNHDVAFAFMLDGLRGLRVLDPLLFKRIYDTRMLKTACDNLRRGGPKSFDFAAMDAIVAWAKANDLAIRGHTLLWHRAKWSPEWLNNYDFGAAPATEAARLLTEHIRTITDRYRGTILSYDVVNETVLPDGTGLEQTSLSRAMGSAEAVVDLAFHTARGQLPDAELCYNDYMSWEPDHRAHCRAVLGLLEGFRKRGVPVDTLGVQSHIEMLTGLDPASRLGPYCENEWRQFLDEVVAMGYKLKITEFDVKDKALPGNVALRDAKVAEFARRYFDLMLEYEQVNDVLAWGLIDKYNWLQGFAPRDDKREVRGCPYGSDFHPKPLRETLAAVLPTGAAHTA